MTDTPNPPPNPPSPGSTPPPEPGAVPPATPATDLVADPADVEKNKVFAVLAYLGILVLVPLLAAKDSPFAKYHTNQGLLLLLTAVATGVAVFIVAALGAFVTAMLHLGVGMCCVGLLGFAQFAVVVAFMIMGIINAATGQMKPLPIIGKYTLIK